MHVPKHKVNIRRLPDDVLKSLKLIADEIIQDTATKNPLAKKVYDSFSQFRKQTTAWHDVSELAHYNARSDV